MFPPQPHLTRQLRYREIYNQIKKSLTGTTRQLRDEPTTGKTGGPGQGLLVQKI